jgi:hypothetical protein
VTQLHDVGNVPAFVQAAVQRWRTGSAVRLEHGEHGELVAEGIVALYELARSYEHHRHGYEQPGSFAGFAARFLPGRLTTAWHRLHPEHVYGTGPDGRRAWRYLSPALSLEALAEHRPDTLALARPITAGRMPARETETLWCEAGGHEWTRQRLQGRKPATCHECRSLRRPAPGQLRARARLPAQSVSGSPEGPHGRTIRGS